MKGLLVHKTFDKNILNFVRNLLNIIIKIKDGYLKKCLQI
jgi:hypothetical protein